MLIKNVTVVLPDRLVEDSAVLVEDGKIARVCRSGEAHADESALVVDAGGGYLLPGFIDLHFLGSGLFLIDNGPEDLSELCRLLPSYGVTSFLPTVCPRPEGQDADVVRSLSTVESDGSQILGFHLEGPFLSFTGCLPPEAIGAASLERVQNLIAAAKPYGAVFSVSPEAEGIIDLIPAMAESGMPVFVTHTKADVKQTQAAIEAGVRHATHFYDVFYAPDETEPGVRPCGAVEAILADPRVSVDFILDGVHVDPVAVAMALQCKGPDRVCLITDANVGAGLPPGRYKFGDSEVEFAYEGGPARLAEGSAWPGALAGSGLSMDRAVRNAISMLNIELPQAVRMASTNPAGVLGLEQHKGRIQEGLDADLVLLDDELKVIQTWVGGRCVYTKDT